MEGFWELKLTGLSVAVNYIGMIADWNVVWFTPIRID